MPTRLDWVGEALPAIVAGSAAWLVSWVTLRRFRQERDDRDMARNRSHLNGALSALSSAGVEWRQLYEEECRRNQELVRHNEDLEIEKTKLELKVADLEDRLKRGLV
jgi:hypothetical protein